MQVEEVVCVQSVIALITYKKKGKNTTQYIKKKGGIFSFLGGRGGHSSICIYFYHHHTRSVFKTRFLFMGGPGPAHLMLSSRNSSRGSKLLSKARDLIELMVPCKKQIHQRSSADFSSWLTVYCIFFLSTVPANVQEDRENKFGMF